MALRQLHVSKGAWRSGTAEAREIQDVALPTTWNHVEAGTAAIAGMPTLFVVEEGVIGGLFDLGDAGHVVTSIDLARPDRERSRNAAVHWCHSVREARGAIVKPLDDIGCRSVARGGGPCPKGRCSARAPRANLLADSSRDRCAAICPLALRSTRSHSRTHRSTHAAAKPSLTRARRLGEGGGFRRCLG
jgi:hypothetical protein